MKRYPIILLGLFVAAIIWSFIEPLSEEDWLLEISPVLVAAPVIIYLANGFKISNLSYTLIFLYMLLPIMQAHFGVAYVPFGFKLGELWGTTRNMFDRLTHLAFGLLWTYPLYEIFRQSIGKRNFLNYLIPGAVLMGFASIYEIIEWVVGKYAGPNLAFLFVAAQQDIYDAAKDMAMTLWGVVVALFIIFIVIRIRGINIRKLPAKKS